MIALAYILASTIAGAIAVLVTLTLWLRSALLDRGLVLEELTAEKQRGADLLKERDDFAASLSVSQAEAKDCAGRLARVETDRNECYRKAANDIASSLKSVPVADAARILDNLLAQPLGAGAPYTPTAIAQSRTTTDVLPPAVAGPGDAGGKSGG